MKRELSLGLSMSVVDIFCSALGATVAWYLVLASEVTRDAGFRSETARFGFSVKQDDVTYPGDPTGISVSYLLRRPDGQGNKLIRPETSTTAEGSPIVSIDPEHGGKGRYEVTIVGQTNKEDVLYVFLHDWHLSNEHAVKVDVRLVGPRGEESYQVTLTRESPCKQLSLDGVTDKATTTPFAQDWREYSAP